MRIFLLTLLAAALTGCATGAGNPWFIGGTNAANMQAAAVSAAQTESLQSQIHALQVQQASILNALNMMQLDVQQLGSVAHAPHSTKITPVAVKPVPLATPACSPCCFADFAGIILHPRARLKSGFRHQSVLPTFLPLLPSILPGIRNLLYPVGTLHP